MNIMYILSGETIRMRTVADFGREPGGDMPQVR